MAWPGVLDVGWNSCHSRNLAMVIIMMTERMMVAVLMKMMMTVRWPPKGKPWYSSSPRLSLGSNLMLRGPSCIPMMAKMNMIKITITMLTLLTWLCAMLVGKMLN